MQPTFHARFITNHRYENIYLCDGKTGVIQKEFQSNLSINSQRSSIANIEENNNNNSVSVENTIQFQINSSMQLEYQNSSNIRFAFSCLSEQFKFQLGVPYSKQLSTIKRISQDKVFLTKRSSSIKSNDISNFIEKQQIQSRRTSTEQILVSYMQELNSIRKQIQHICDSWLKECRTILGINISINSYKTSFFSI